MSQALISVIIPVYKVEKYLDRCLESIVNQTYKNLEIILIDDGSPDNCPAICDEYAQKDSRIKVIHKANGGVSSARNKGIDVATGDYIGFVDSDDWIEPDMYETLIKNAEQYNSDISRCSYVISESMSGQTSKSQDNGTIFLEDSIEMRRNQICSNCNANVWSGIYKKSYSSITNLMSP